MEEKLWKDGCAADASWREAGALSGRRGLATYDVRFGGFRFYRLTAEGNGDPTGKTRDD